MSQSTRSRPHESSGLSDTHQDKQSRYQGRRNSRPRSDQIDLGQMPPDPSLFDSTRSRNINPNFGGPSEAKLELGQIMMGDFDQLDKFYKKYDRHNSDTLAPFRPEDESESPSIMSTMRLNQHEMVQGSEDDCGIFDTRVSDTMELPNESMLIPLQCSEIKQLKDELRLFNKGESDRVRSTRESFDRPLAQSTTLIQFDSSLLCSSDEASKEMTLLKNSKPAQSMLSKAKGSFEHSQQSMELFEGSGQGGNYETERPMSRMIQPNEQPFLKGAHLNMLLEEQVVGAKWNQTGNRPSFEEQVVGGRGGGRLLEGRQFLRQGSTNWAGEEEEDYGQEIDGKGYDWKHQRTLSEVDQLDGPRVGSRDGLGRGFGQPAEEQLATKRPPQQTAQNNHPFGEQTGGVKPTKPQMATPLSFDESPVGSRSNHENMNQSLPFDEQRVGQKSKQPTARQPSFDEPPVSQERLHSDPKTALPVNPDLDQHPSDEQLRKKAKPKKQLLKKKNNQVVEREGMGEEHNDVNYQSVRESGGGLGGVDRHKRDLKSADIKHGRREGEGVRGLEGGEVAGAVGKAEAHDGSRGASKGRTVPAKNKSTPRQGRDDGRGKTGGTKGVPDEGSDCQAVQEQSDETTPADPLSDSRRVGRKPPSKDAQLKPAPPGSQPLMNRTEQLLFDLLRAKARSLPPSQEDIGPQTVDLMIDLAAGLKHELLAELQRDTPAPPANAQLKLSQLEKENSQLKAEVDKLKLSDKAPKDDLDSTGKRMEEGKKDTLMVKSKRAFEEENELLKKRIRKMEEEFKGKEAKAREAVAELVKKVGVLEAELRERDKTVLGGRQGSPLKPTVKGKADERKDKGAKDGKSVSPLKTTSARELARVGSVRKESAKPQKTGQESVKVSQTQVGEPVRVEGSALTAEGLRLNESRKVYVSARKDKQVGSAEGVRKESANSLAEPFRDSIEGRVAVEEVIEGVKGERGKDKDGQTVSGTTESNGPSKETRQSGEAVEGSQVHNDSGQLESPFGTKGRVKSNSTQATDKRTSLAEQKGQARQSPSGKVSEKKPDESKTDNSRQVLTRLCHSFVNSFPGLKSSKEPLDLESFSFTANAHYQKFLKWNSQQKKVAKSTTYGEKVHNCYENNVQEIMFATGAKRVIFPDNYIVVFFQNKDVKQTLPDQSVIYYYAEHDTTQISKPGDSMQVGLSGVQVRQNAGGVPLRLWLQKGQVS
jgi:hypothetical protein